MQRIVTDRSRLPEFITEGIKQFVDEVVPQNAAGQALRVARRFGLVAVAGELASHYGLTGWAGGEAETATKKCFNAWLENFGGVGNQEERAMLAQVRAFFEAHGASRFATWNDPDDQHVRDRAGFSRIVGDAPEYFVFPEAFRREVCKGFDAKAVATALRKAGWIEPDKSGKTAQTQRLPGMGPTRCYVFTGRMWEAEQ